MRYPMWYQIDTNGGDNIDFWFLIFQVAIKQVSSVHD